MQNRRTIRNPQNFQAFLAYLGDMPMPYTVSVSKGAKRSLDQNALAHKWYAEIAAQRGDVDAGDVKAECNVIYGVPILRRDDEAYARFLDRLDLDHEAMVYASKRGLLPCTSLMTTKQLAEYGENLCRDYRQQGFTLTDPEARKYEAEA